MAEDSRERLVRYLQDAHAAEVGVKEMLESFLNDSEDTSIRSMLQEHIVTTESQADRLEQRLSAYDESPSGGKGFFNSLMAKMGELMHGAHDEYDKVTQNVIKAYATEHLEIGMYESLYHYATSVGDDETAMLARQIQQEEQRTAERLFPMIQECAMATVSATSEADRGRAYPG
jgi:ferritin-like metal-binding protein YciE